MDKDFLMVIFLLFLFQHAFEHAFFFKGLLILFKFRLANSNLKDCQKRVLMPQLHQAIVLLQDWPLFVRKE